MWTLLAHSLWILASAPHSSASLLSEQRDTWKAYHDSEEEPLVQATIFGLRRNRIQNPIELFPRRIRNAIIAQRVAGNVHHHFIRLPPTKYTLAEAHYQAQSCLSNLHAVEVDPFVHARPSIAAVTVVEIVRIVALIDGSGWLEGFLRHVGGYGGVV